MNIELKACSIEDDSKILEMIREIGPGENGFQNRGYDMKDEEFRPFLFQSIKTSMGIGLEPGYVPQTLFWLMVDGWPVGYGKLRIYLNEKLRKIGGHIGYCIRPAERQKGYGTILLREILKKAEEANIPKALVTCLDNNIGSRSVIENNGGKLADIEDGECHYWIQLDQETGIREIHPDDYAEIIELWKRTPGMGINEADSESNIHHFLLCNRGLSFCYKEKNRIIGTSLCGQDQRRGYIYHTAVSPEFRGRGIGRILVEKSLGGLRMQGINKCHLFVFADNELGNSFWSSTGWVKRNDLFVYSRTL